jgi:hypothetical protein
MTQNIGKLGEDEGIHTYRMALSHSQQQLQYDDPLGVFGYDK